MVAVGTMKLRRALTASGIPMECPPPSTSVQQHQQTFDARIFLRGHQLRDDMLILRGLLALRRFRMAFDLADDGQAVDLVPPSRGNRSGGGDKPGLLFGRGKLLFLRKILFRHA